MSMTIQSSPECAASISATCGEPLETQRPSWRWPAASACLKGLDPRVDSLRVGRATRALRTAWRRANIFAKIISVSC
eukprot:7287376-Prymnesium_polylepis.1